MGHGTRKERVSSRDSDRSRRLRLSNVLNRVRKHRVLRKLATGAIFLTAAPGIHSRIDPPAFPRPSSSPGPGNPTCRPKRDSDPSSRGSPKALPGGADCRRWFDILGQCTFHTPQSRPLTIRGNRFQNGFTADQNFDLGCSKRQTNSRREGRARTSIRSKGVSATEIAKQLAIGRAPI